MLHPVDGCECDFSLHSLIRKVAVACSVNDCVTLREENMMSVAPRSEVTFSLGPVASV